MTNALFTVNGDVTGVDFHTTMGIPVRVGGVQCGGCYWATNPHDDHAETWCPCSPATWNRTQGPYDVVIESVPPVRMRMRSFRCAGGRYRHWDELAEGRVRTVWSTNTPANVTLSVQCSLRQDSWCSARRPMQVECSRADGTSCTYSKTRALYQPNSHRLTVDFTGDPTCTTPEAAECVVRSGRATAFSFGRDPSVEVAVISDQPERWAEVERTPSSSMRPPSDCWSIVPAVTLVPWAQPAPSAVTSGP